MSQTNAVSSGSVLIIGAGAAGSVVAKKCALNRDVFSRIHLASRTLAKCEKIQRECATPITISQVDADDAQQVRTLIDQVRPGIVINMALPYQDLAIMDACLATGVHYLDTANYEPRSEAKFSYTWQWAYHERFREKGIMAVLGCGFDPGVISVFCAYAQERLFDEIHTIDIVDCNAGSHGKAFATNFNPEINIREITQRGKYWQDGKWIETEPLSVSRMIDFPEVGPRKAYLIYHEEEESLVKNIRGLKRIRFWMTFSDAYLTHLEVLQNVGLTRIDAVQFEGRPIVPLQFLKALLPEPSSLAENYTGKTSIGAIIQGVKDGVARRVIVYNVCDHAETNREIGAQAVSYTTGVPAMTGAMMMARGLWAGKGVFNVEEFPPEPFLDEVARQGLPWRVQELPVESAREPLAKRRTPLRPSVTVPQPTSGSPRLREPFRPKIIALTNENPEWSDLDKQYGDEMWHLLLEGLEQQGYTFRPFKFFDNLDLLDDFDPAEWLVWNWGEELAGEPWSEAKVAEEIEHRGFAYTGSTPEILRLSQSRMWMKERLRAANLPTLPARLFSDPSRASEWTAYPAIVKGANQHSSRGIDRESVVHDPQQLAQRISYLRERYEDDALVERFLDSREFQVAVWGNRSPSALPPSEIVFSTFSEMCDRMHTAEWKVARDSRGYKEITMPCPAPVDRPDWRARIEEVAIRAYTATGMRDYARFDLRMLDDEPQILDVNSNPELDPLSVVRAGAAAVGKDYGQMVSQIIQFAAERMPRRA
jgi:saccharopine dehydrogenase (NAD+, L-lysine-forming)